LSRRPVRVLHTIDGLAGGGSERWLWEIVRLSSAGRVVHRVVPIHPDLGRYVYADRLREIGALGRAPGSAMGPGSPAGSPEVPVITTRPVDQVPAMMRPVLRGLWYAGAVFPAACGRLAIEAARFRPDVIHAHTFHGFVAGIVLHCLLRRPLVCTQPSSFDHVVECGYGWMPGLYARCHRRVDRFITNYPDELRGIGVADEKILVFRGMVDIDGLERLAADRAAVRRRLRASIGLQEQARIALSVGRLDPDKGHDAVLSAIGTAVRARADFHWVVAGQGSLRDDLARQAADLGIGDRVHFLGFLADPLPWYVASDCYVRTTRLEGDNLSSMQAMGAGLPVVGFATGSEAELITRVGHGLLVPPGRGDALAGALVELLASPQHARALGERGIQYAAEHFSNRQVIETCEAMYEQVTLGVRARDVHEAAPIASNHR
jgi:glycosyltransferase involved in cell wall biosynthesis